MQKEKEEKDIESTWLRRIFISEKAKIDSEKNTIFLSYICNSQHMHQ